MEVLRFKFKKGHSLRFISHLDIMRALRRAFKRAEIPMEYSKGFNPHPELMLGLPLSVGNTSDCEYGEIELSEQMDIDDFITQTNATLPRDLEIIAAQYRINKKNKANIMAAINKVQVRLIPDEKIDNGEITALIEKLMAEPTIEVEKVSKKGTKLVDIKPKIQSIEAVDGEIVLACDAGSRSNLNPELVVKALGRLDKRLEYCHIHREKLWVLAGNEDVSPMCLLALS